jgi:hypothetical protein
MFNNSSYTFSRFMTVYFIDASEAQLRKYELCEVMARLFRHSIVGVQVADVSDTIKYKCATGCSSKNSVAMERSEHGYMKLELLVSEPISTNGCVAPISFSDMALFITVNILVGNTAPDGTHLNRDKCTYPECLDETRMQKCFSMITQNDHQARMNGFSHYAIHMKADNATVCRNNMKELGQHDKDLIRRRFLVQTDEKFNSKFRNQNSIKIRSQL